MRITQEAEYAIQIVDYLAHNSKRSGAVEISEGITAPLRFTKNILQKLARSGLIRSYLGNRGGYELGRPPEEISLFDVMEVPEGPIWLHRCLTREHECAYIPNKQQSPYHVAFRELSSDMEHKMRKFKFSSAAYGGGTIRDLRLGDFLGWPDDRERDHFVGFSTQRQGYNRDEVDVYIARLHQEHKEMNVKYKTLQKEQALLKMQSTERP